MFGQILLQTACHTAVEPYQYEPEASESDSSEEDSSSEDDERRLGNTAW